MCTKDNVGIQCRKLAQFPDCSWQWTAKTSIEGEVPASTKHPNIYEQSSILYFIEHMFVATEITIPVIWKALIMTKLLVCSSILCARWGLLLIYTNYQYEFSGKGPARNQPCWCGCGIRSWIHGWPWVPLKASPNLHTVGHDKKRFGEWIILYIIWVTRDNKSCELLFLIGPSEAPQWSVRAARKVRPDAWCSECSRGRQRQRTS